LVNIFSAIVTSIEEEERRQEQRIRLLISAAVRIANLTNIIMEEIGTNYSGESLTNNLGIIRQIVDETQEVLETAESQDVIVEIAKSALKTAAQVVRSQGSDDSAAITLHKVLCRLVEFLVKERMLI